MVNNNIEQKPTRIKARYFSDEELTHSDKAVALGLKNQPTDEHWQNLQALVTNILDPLREAFGAPITINSGYRSEAVNRAVGGAARSQHTRGEAADITSQNNARLLQLAKRLPFDQIVVYTDRGDSIRWLHVSHKRVDRQRGQILYKRV